ncbi:iron-sulfur cluster assembly protein [Amycolatopsis vastitatis]|uniref:Metal-sulfur cluster biosynthetic enzyme n=1 Tax=Amycolatopsis vastitatis TaxID=1905142 RepID=A0A229SM69_9PSEU|nr:iron-sulfur cluster assembly protein [Amycolatopsis vastitatis]OXM60107.1 metal-sulfur cluster biosynthetic enzyme [Amycolatopsis vastitatis]
MTAVVTGARAAVWAALGTVRDPELDEPLTDLGFVARCEVSDAGHAVVRLRLPTYFCAPNFAFLMVADAYDAVAGVPGLTGLDIRLDDHFASDVINRGVAARQGFVASFEGEAADELDTLRYDFVRKAVLAGTDRVCRSLGRDPRSLTLGDVPPSPDLDRLRARRRELGLPAEDGDPLLLDPATGRAVSAADAKRHLAFARLTRTSMEANSGVCRGMLRARYALTSEEEGTG